jgi:hypothetical protein
VLAVLASSCDSLPVVPCLEADGGCPGCETRSCKDASVMALAHDLDCLEAHLERYGSVVAKQPDVWGQARMTKHREEYEKETAAAKGCGCAHEGWLDYYLPEPSAEARHAFIEYVRCRWPIHVFALDPETQDQNIADAFALQRDLQLAMSLAFVSGQISANNMMKFARRIEQNYETIALNRTEVGFSHGGDTFGWRFYPRFQTPDIAGNLTVFFRDLLIGGPNRAAVLRQRQLEPGPRECVAVVIMPSFVPYVTFESTANWFKLTNPKCKELNVAQAMKLSRRVKAIQDCGPNVCDADCYRCGDLPLLLRKAEQLSARLPFQSQLVQVPYENTLGGFAMFNTGVTDLAPRLTGWYGIAGVEVQRPDGVVTNPPADQPVLLATDSAARPVAVPVAAGPGGGLFS